MRADLIKRLLELLRPQTGLVVVSALCRVTNQGLGVAIPAVAVGYLASIAVGGTGVLSAVGVLAGLALAKGVFRYLEQYTGHAVAFGLLAHMRNQVFRWLERLEPARLEHERGGDLVARVSGDVDRIEPFYAHTIAPLVAAVVVPLLTLLALGPIGGPWIVVALAPFILLYLILVPLIGSRRISSAAAEARRLSGISGAVVADVVQGAREVAVLGAGDRVIEGVTNSADDIEEVESVIARSSALRSLVGGVIAGGAVVAVAFVAVAVDLDFQTMAVSIVLAWTVMGPMRALEQIVPDTEQSLAAAQRLFDLEDLEPQETGGTEPVTSGEVRFESVTVRAADRVLVDGIDLVVPGGAFLAVVGPSGSGKSTLVQTLLRHRDPTSGRVLLGGRDIRELSPDALSENVAVVPQRPDFFHGTLATNLLIARQEASEGQMLDALGRARLRDWVESLENGLDTHLGEGGVGMSGGQLQRLAMARAFLRSPGVLVLDEATSELDSATEKAVLDEVYEDRGKRTLIVVAHRMETVVSADLIAVMNHGRVVEKGRHDDLIALGGLYSALWERHTDMLAGV